jgi:hypothetical protein
MALAGCRIINFGVESGDPDILRRIRKEVDLEEVEDAFVRCRELGIRTYATFIVGSPGETEETTRRSIAFAKRIRPSLASFHVATAYPGTPMYDEALRDGTVRPRWWHRRPPSPEDESAFRVRWGWTDAGALTFDDFDPELWQRRATRAFYLRPRFVWDTLVFVLRNPSFLRHIWNLGRELVPFYKLKKLFPWRGRLSRAARLAASSHCPSLPNPQYEPRAGSGS